MADNVEVSTRVPSETATATVATDDVGSAHYQYVKAAFGADGTATKVSASDPLPVTQTASNVASANSTGSTVSVTTAVTLLAAFATRRRAMILPTDGAIYLSLGGTADNTAALIPAGTPINIDGYSGAVNVVAVSGTVVVSRMEY